VFDKISLKSMCHYEKLTGKNAMQLFQKDNKSATDLRDMVFIIKYTKDNTTTFDSVENMTGEEFSNILNSVSEETK
jgi:hypothetical protein